MSSASTREKAASGIATAASLLDRPAPADYVAHWTDLIARPPARAEDQSESVVVFRLGREWFGLQTTLCVEVAPRKRIQSLPHRARDRILGLANVRGELLICISLAAILRVDTDSPPAASTADEGRLIVAAWRDGPVAFPADEVRGVHRFGRQEVRAVPATVSQSAATFSSGVLAIGSLSIGLLDGEALRHAIERSLK